jgi:uncharacterized membrane protein (TIGR02234 family)
MTGHRIKLVLIVTVLLASALALLAWTQTWIQADVGAQGGAVHHLDVTGSQAAPALTALALAGLALAGALTIAGIVIRVVLGILEVLLGVSVFLASLSAVVDPVGASASAVTAVTGIAGPESLKASVDQASLSGWPYLALGASCLMALAGVLVVVTARHWPGPTARYQAVRLAPVSGHGAVKSKADGTADETGRATTGAAPGTANGDSVGDWDDLSRGNDPTV